MRHGIGASVSGIVHDQCPLLHLLADKARHVGIAVARRGRFTRIGIPHHALYLKGRIQLFYQGGGVVGICHVGILVSVVAHEAHHVLPYAGIGIVDIAYYLVYHHGSLVGRTGRDTSYGYVGLGRQHVAALIVVEQAEVVVGNITVCSTVRVLALIAQQEIVGRVAFPVVAQHTVVPCAVTHQQQVAGHVGRRLCTVVEHLQVAPVGIGIRRAAGELVEQLVGRHYVNPQPVFFLMQFLQPLGLYQQFL